MFHVCCVYLFKVKVARVLKMATTIEIQIQKEFALGRLGALFKGGLNILWILTLKYGFGPGYWDFQETGPWYFVLFFLKTAVDQYFAFIKGWRFFFGVIFVKFCNPVLCERNRQRISVLNCPDVSLFSEPDRLVIFC